MSVRHTRILLVDGSPESRAGILAPLNGRGYRVTQARSAREGLEEIYRSVPDMVLLSRSLSDMDGLHFCSALKNDAQLRQIPVIVLDPASEPEAEVAAGEAGADDCLCGRVNLEELDGRIQQVFRVGTLGINYHPVTGLPGYNTCYRRLLETLAKGASFAVCFFDISGFRRFNQEHGYESGDEILGATARLVSRVLNSRQRVLDFFGHLGSDDFVLITDPEGVEGLCTEIVERFEWAFPGLSAPGNAGVQKDRASACRQGGSLPVRIFLAVGILTHEGGGAGHVADLLDQGGRLLQQAKGKAESRWVRQHFRGRDERPLSEELAGSLTAEGEHLGGSPLQKTTGRLSERVRLFQELLAAGAFQLHFQPIVCLASGDVYGFEALLRGPEGTSLESPVILLGLARKLDMEPELDLLCLGRLAQLAAGIRREMLIFFNVSPESFFNPRFRETCEKTALELPAGRVVLEITRKRRIREFPGLRESIQRFRSLGYRVAVDDVKAGTLSLRTVLEVMPDYIKTDVSLVRGIHADPGKQAVLERFTGISSRQRITLISEGVESEQEKDYLLRHGVRFAQGFLFSPAHPLPVPAPAVAG